jgi:hypothetical protein
MKIRRKINKTSRALWIILLTGICAPVWAIPASSAVSDQFVEWLWKGFREGAKKSGPITRIKTVICLCILGLTLFVGVPLAIASVRNF